MSASRRMSAERMSACARIVRASRVLASADASASQAATLESASEPLAERGTRGPKADACVTAEVERAMRFSSYSAGAVCAGFDGAEPIVSVDGGQESCLGERWRCSVCQRALGAMLADVAYISPVHVRCAERDKAESRSVI